MRDRERERERVRVRVRGERRKKEGGRVLPSPATSMKDLRVP